MKRFVSPKGSWVEVSGKHQGIFDISYDWLEEGGCCDAMPEFNRDYDEPAIIARCECCEPQVVRLEKQK